MGKIDLHLHSSVSDGVFSPAELVEKAVNLGLTAISLTDHDNTDGIPPAMEAAVAYPDLTFIPGVEISTDTPDGEVHMLGYYVDHTEPRLGAFLERMQTARVKRARRMVERLARLGVPVEWERVMELAGDGTVGRPQVAQALLEKGYIENIKEAFSKYLSFKGPAYAPRMKVTPEEAIGMILGANGIPVLAHPLTHDAGSPVKVIGELAAAGLAGVEAYYKKYTEEERAELVRLAAQHGLIVTGGTDFHGLDAENELMMGEAGVPQEVIDRLEALAAQRPLKLSGDA